MTVKLGKDEKMSIELENPVTPTEKSDAIGNFIEQMYLAYKTNNDAMFMKAYNKASELSFDLTLALEE